MQVLFIGGTGVISSACSQLAVERGIDLCLFNRGDTRRPIPDGIRFIKGDIRDIDTATRVLEGHVYDVVVDWVGYKPEQITEVIKLFRDRVGQFVFISSASVYQTPPAILPVTESTPLDNPYWSYSRDKIACEHLLMQAYRELKFPVTIVRPSHTYDKTMLPVHGGYTIIDRMRKGKKVIVHGDGTSLWVLTHHRDFAKGFLGLLANIHAIGESFHITSEEILTWNQIYETLARVARTKAHIVHVPSDYIATFDPEWGAGLLGDKAHSMIFDNSKIKRLVPDFAATISFSMGAQEILDWYDADPARQIVNVEMDHLIDKIITAHESSWPVVKR